ncbi:MAG: QueT transporter family protein [Thermoleophilia bacterium]
MKKNVLVISGIALAVIGSLGLIGREGIVGFALPENDHGMLIVMLVCGLLYASGVLFVVAGYMRNMTVLQIARGAMIAAMYAVLTLSPGLNAISYGQVQFRISEMLMPLAAFEMAAVPGLWIGCIIANIGSPFGAIDLTFGAGMTLVAAIIMRFIGPRWEGMAAPVIVNAFGVALVLNVAGELPYLPSALWVGLGELGVMAVLGAPLFVLLKKNPAIIGLGQEKGI